MSNIGANLTKLPQTCKKRGKVQVGKTYWGTTERFKGLFMCQVEKIYTNSAAVKITTCQDPEDDETQYELGDRTVVSLKKLVKVRN